MSKKKKKLSPHDFRKTRKKQITREIIINYAEKEFLEKGYAAATLEDIALNSGNTRTTLYNYFESKDDLFTAVLSKAYTLFIEIISEEINKSSNNELATILLSYVQFNSKYSTQSELFLSTQSSVIYKKIYEKVALGQKLTESEEEYRNLDAEVVKIVCDVLIKYLKNSSINSEFHEKMRKIFINFVFMIRELIVTDKLLKKPQEETKESLEIIIRIIEQGLKNY